METSNISNLIKSSASLPDFAPSFVPSSVEIFDQHGLLVSMILGETIYEAQRNSAESEYLAWYLDGELALFMTGGQILVNRMNNMALSHDILGA